MSTFTLSGYTLGTLVIGLFALVYYTYVHSALYLAVVDRWGWEAGERFLRIEDVFSNLLIAFSMTLVMLNCFETFRS